MIPTAELVHYCRAASVDEQLIGQLREAAISAVQEAAGKYFGPEAALVDIRLWRGGPLELSATPKDGEVTFARWTGDAWEDMDAGSFVVEGDYVHPARSWGHRPIRVRATYTGGTTDPPEGVKQYVRMLVEHWYSNRGAVTVGEVSADMEKSLDFLIRQHRRTVV